MHRTDFQLAVLSYYGSKVSRKWQHFYLLPVRLLVSFVWTTVNPSVSVFSALRAYALSGKRLWILTVTILLGLGLPAAHVVSVITVSGSRSPLIRAHSMSCCAPQSYSTHCLPVAILPSGFLQAYIPCKLVFSGHDCRSNLLFNDWQP